MNWTKSVLFFQAIVTLIIGLFFIAEFFVVSLKMVSQAATSMNPDFISSVSQEIISRFKVGGYITLIASSLELLILSRL